MNRYFNNISTLEELRKQYKELLKPHHPDNGGNVSEMQEVNVEYDKLFKILKNQPGDGAMPWLLVTWKNVRSP